MRLIEQDPYSYRALPGLADLPDEGPMAVMDAQCGLCARGARWIARNDKAGEFRILPMQSEKGASLLRHYGLDPEDPLSWLLIVDGRGYTSLDAVIRTGARLGGVWKGLGVLRLLPRHLQDSLYGLVARNRYKVMGRADLCALPDADVQERLVT